MPTPPKKPAAKKPATGTRRKATTTRKATATKKGAPVGYKFSKAIADELLQRMALGETVADIEKDPRMPNQVDIWRRRKMDPDFESTYVRAREDQMHAWADQIISFADNPQEDVLRDEDGKPILKPNGQPRLFREHIDRTKLRIETRKWLMSKILPQVFGDKHQLEVQHSWEEKDDGELMQGLRDAADKAGMSEKDLGAFIAQCMRLQ